MNKSQRIKIDLTNQTDKYLKLKLESDVDSLEFLSMSLSTKDVYQDFNADYGVVLGRVIANEGIGIPNAKISVFIPLSEEDEFDSNITSIYPFKNPRDKNNEGKRYNLLPRVGIYNPDGSITPKQPFGSFPLKVEVVTNEKLLNVHKKYYKYTAVTNDGGDYMIFGVPVGTQTLHLSVDITDIGKFSMNPPSMVTNLGYSPNLFTDNNTRIKPSTDLGDLPHIETQEISVDVIPFWGDEDVFEIGITRQDFRIRATLINTFTIFGTSFTDGHRSMWGGNPDGSGDVKGRMYLISKPEEANALINSKRIGRITEKIYYYPSTLTDSYINSVVSDPIVDMIVLDPSEYSSFKRDGDFVFIVNCNRKKVVTDEFGNFVEVDDSYSGGIYTEFKGFVTFEYALDDVPLGWVQETSGRNYRPLRYKYKFPQYEPILGNGIQPVIDQNFEPNQNKIWRKQHFTFNGGKIYSVAKFVAITYNNTSGEQQIDTSAGNTRTLTGDRTNTFFPTDSSNRYYFVGAIQSNETDENDDVISEEDINISPPSNRKIRNTRMFGTNWLNFAIYFPQVAYLNYDIGSTSSYSKLRAASNFNWTHDDTQRPSFYTRDNRMFIAAGVENTKWFARNDIHWTDFIEVPVGDIVNMSNMPKKGFDNEEMVIHGHGDITYSNYRNGTNQTSYGFVCPYNGGFVNGSRNSNGTNQDPKIYFYKGFDEADCIQYLIDLGIVRK